MKGLSFSFDSDLAMVRDCARKRIGQLNQIIHGPSCGLIEDSVMAILRSRLVYWERREKAAALLLTTDTLSFQWEGSEV